MSRGGRRARAVQRLLVAFGLLADGAISAVLAQQPAAVQENLETVVVTGTLIKRADFETASPIQVLTAEDLQRSGYTTVSEVLRNLAANGQGALSQSVDFALAGGGSGVALRGLTVAATLTLIDGERMVPYPLSDDGQRNFVDVSGIPLLAVDRIEVLKDGASAEYGSDAIAGVVNVILKRSFTGAHSSLEVGTTGEGDGTTEHLTLNGGMGELAADDYNAYVAVEFRHQDNILAIHRSGVWNTRNFTNFAGYNNLDGAGTTNPNSAPVSAPLGGYLVNPAVGGLDRTAIFLGNCDYDAFIANRCTYDPPRQVLQPQTGNLNVLARYTRNLAGGWQAVVTGTLFRSEAEQIGEYSQVTAAPYQNIAFGPGIPLSLVPPAGLLFTVPAGYPGNTFHAPTQIVVPAVEIGQQTYQIVTRTYRLFGDVTGKAAGWDLDLAAGIMHAALTYQATGLISGAALQNALNHGYVFGSANGASLWAPLEDVEDTNALQVIDLRGSRDLASLPGGPLAIALGAGFYHLNKDSPAPPAVGSGAQSGANFFAIGSQTNSSAYLEVVAHPVHGLELDAAARWDHFNTYGSSTDPKLGLTYTPFRVLTVRGTHGKGFRAPNPAEAGTAGVAGFAGFPATDPVLCPSGTGTAVGDFPSQCLIFPFAVNVANQNLQPVTSTNDTFGIVLRPLEPLTLSVDYWDTKINRDIQSGVNAFNFGANPALFPLVRGPEQVLPVVTAIGPGGVPVMTNARTPAGPYAYQLFPYQNFSQTRVNGVDLDLTVHRDLGAAGRLSGALDYTHVFHYQFGYTNLVELAGTHGPSIVSGDTGNPRNRATASLGWDRNPLSVTLSVYYVGNFNITDPSLGIDTCTAGLNSNYLRFPAQPVNLGNWCNVAHFTSVDLYSQYTLSRHLSVHGAVLNVLDAPPPLDLQTSGANQASAAYNPAVHQAGAVGRFFSVGGTYTF